MYCKKIHVHIYGISLIWIMKIMWYTVFFSSSDDLAISFQAGNNYGVLFVSWMSPGGIFRCNKQLCVVISTRNNITSGIMFIYMIWHMILLPTSMNYSFSDVLCLCRGKGSLKKKRFLRCYEKVYILDIIVKHLASEMTRCIWEK